MGKSSYYKKHDIKIENYGTSPENPVLMNSIADCQIFCNKLARLNTDMEYKRRGSTMAPGFEKPMDIYDFRYYGQPFCSLYLYPYHHTNVEEVPLPFHDLDRLEELAVAALFETPEAEEEDLDDEDEAYTLIASCLAKNGIDERGLGSNREWTTADQQLWEAALADLGLKASIETMIMSFWEDYSSNRLLPHRDYFIQDFTEMMKALRLLRGRDGR